MTVSNPELRLQAIETGLVKEQRKLSKMMFKNQNNLEVYNKLLDVWQGYEDLGEIWKEAKRENNSRYSRKRRLWQKIYAMFLTGKPCLFLTLTFTDTALSLSDFDKRRRWVRDFLKKYSDYYIANIDFGDIVKNPESNEREHYHAIIMLDHNMDKDQFKEFVNSWMYKYTDRTKQERFMVGTLNARRIRADMKSAKKLASYVDKLAFHAIKDSTKRNKIIYGKDSIRLMTKETLIKLQDALRREPEGEPSEDQVPAQPG